MAKLKIVYKKLSDLKQYEKNPRRNDDAVRFVKNSIEKFGFKNPIIIDKEGTIVAGHTRYKAAIQLGMEEVPTIIVDDLTPAQLQAFRIADNKTSEKATWDNTLLKEELNDILNDFDMTEFGFGDFELTILSGDFEPEPYDKDVTAKYEETGESFLAKRRVIITYTDEEEEMVKELLGLDEIAKVVYDVKEVKG